MKYKPCYDLFAILLSVISGALLAFSLPPNTLNYLGWIAFLPLLAASRMAGKVLVSVFCGMLTSLTCAIILAGQTETIRQHGNLIAAFGSLAIFLAFICVMSGFAAKRYSKTMWALLVPCIAVAAELVSARMFPANIAISQYKNGAALLLASYTGIWGVSFLLWFIPSAIITLFINPRPKFYAITVICLLAAIAFIPIRQARGPEVTAAAIQAPKSASAALETKNAASKAEIAVWPELLMRWGGKTAHTAAKTNNIYIVANFLEPIKNGKSCNSTLTISPQGKQIATSRKKHLFGKEQVTLKKGDLNYPVNCGSFRIGNVICFDTEFTDVTRTLVKADANIITSPNSDPDFKNFLFNHLHSAVIPFRAAENGVPVIWSEGDGLSMIVDNTGKIIAQAPCGKITSVTGKVHLNTKQTIYNRFGDYFAYLCSAAAIAAILVISVAGKQTSTGTL